MARPNFLLLLLLCMSLEEASSYGYFWGALPGLTTSEDCTQSAEESKSEGSAETKEDSAETKEGSAETKEGSAETKEGSAETKESSGESKSEEKKDESKDWKVSFWSVFPPRTPSYAQAYYRPYLAPNYGYQKGTALQYYAPYWRPQSSLRYVYI